ncbi:hypothetical protein QEN19_001110 [Hanseniaspora menglaensis]
MPLSRVSIKFYQLFRIVSFLIYLSLSIRLVILSLFLNHKYFHLDLNKVITITFLSLNGAEILISLFVFRLRNCNVSKIARIAISTYDAFMFHSDVTDLKVFKNWYYYSMLLSFCIWQMYDNFKAIFKNRNRKSAINKFVIKLAVLPIFITSQLVLLVVNTIKLSKKVLLKGDKIYYYSTIALLIFYLPTLIYIIKSRAKRI